MKKEIKDTILRTLNRRKDILTHKGTRNVKFMEERIKKWEHQLETDKKYEYDSAGSFGVRITINRDTNIRLISEFERRLERSYKEISELEEAIEHINSL